MFIYLDESGDMGFNFDQRSPSKHFVITLLVCFDQNAENHIKRTVRKTLKNKLHTTKKKHTSELKGSNLAQGIKKYFFSKIVTGYN